METSFELAAGLIGGLAVFLGWVLSDLLEEQLIGAPRREPKPAAKPAAKKPRPSLSSTGSRALPRAVARPRSVVAPRSAP